MTDSGIVILLPWGGTHTIPYDSSDGEFARGVEIGLLMAELMEFATIGLEMDAGDLTASIRPNNLVMALRIAEAIGLRMEVGQYDRKGLVQCTFRSEQEPETT